MKKYTPNKNGIYSTLVWDGTYKDGIKHRKQITSKKSSADLERKVAEFKKQVENKQSCTTSNTTFVEYSKYWLKNYKSNIRHNTKTMYENIIEKHFSPLLGVPLSDVRRIHLNMVMADKSPYTARQIYLTFKQVVKCAIREHYLPLNALDDIFEDNLPPKITKPEKRALNELERQAIFNVELSESDRMYLLLAYTCGMRREEILALTDKDFNFSENTVTINKVIVFDGNNPRLENTTKSRNSTRVIPIPVQLVGMLKDYLPRHRQLFQTPGKPYLTKSSYFRMWLRIQKAIDDYVGYETNITSHTLRHNYCSMLCYQVPNISIKKISQLLGDSQKIVMEVYTHAVEEKEKTSAAINSLWEGKMRKE